MNEQFGKTSPKPNNRKSDFLENQAKLRSILRTAPQGSKSEIPTHCKASVRPSSLDTPSSTYYGKCYEDHQLRLKLLELTPRNTAEKAAEGVQEFIKQVSNFIEKKNPFKDSSVYPFCRGRGNAASTSFDSVNNNLNHKSEEKNDELTVTNSNSYLESMDWESQNLTLSSNKTSGKISQGKKTRIGGSTKEMSQSEKKRKKGEESSTKKYPEFRRVMTLNENPIFYYENERRGFSIARNDKKSIEGSSKQNPGKKRKPSEIPLRKNRKDGTKNPKPVSLLLKKQMKDVDSSVSIAFDSKKKPFSPIEELSLCSEIQITINAVGSSEKITESGNTSDFEIIKRTISEDSINNTQLSRCCKNSNIPVESNFSCILLSNNQSSSSKKSKILNMDTLKTSSFTILRSNISVLNRLESFHKRNVCSKEKISKSFSKSVLSASKSSFASAKEKLPKNSLSFGLCGERSKQKLKIMGKKYKNEKNGHLGNGGSRTKNKSHLELCKEMIAPGKAECFISRFCKAEKGERRKEKANSKTNLNAENLKKETESNSRIKFSKPEVKTIPKKVLTPNEIKLMTSSSTIPVVSRRKIEEFSKTENPKLTEILKSEKPIQTDVKSKLKVDLLKPNKIMRHASPFSSDTLGGSDSEERPEEDDESSTKTVILEESFNPEDALWCADEMDARKNSMKACGYPEKEDRMLKGGDELEKLTKYGLVIRGASLNLGKDEPPEKPESADSRKIKKKLKIDLNAETNLKETEEDIKSEESFDWLYMNNIQCDVRIAYQKADSRHSENKNMKNKTSNCDCKYKVSTNSINSTTVEEKKLNKPFDSVFRKPRKCCSSLKRRMQYKSSNVNLKGVRKKIRSDAGDRRLPSSSYFNWDLSLNKNSKGSPKSMKVGLNENDKRDSFEDVTAIKLRRRNSEPHSFKEFVWKRTDFATPKGLKPSVSSMASSLRHLNTDDIDDFIFWEPVPQKLTSCWETSLYHFKKPWTVLSCSVFKDNRQSNTPGLILENLRNGGNLSTRQSAVHQTERVKGHKENPFDVEPSIAQKNIDIRNWLAALNFPTPPTSSNEPLSEGNFPMQSTFHPPSLKNKEVNPKRRKVLRNIKFSEEIPEKKDESKEKYKASGKWNTSEPGGLMELIRRKSGGFVTKEQFFDSEHAVRRPNVTVSLCVYTKSNVKECTSREANEKDDESDSKMLNSSYASSQPDVSESARMNKISPDVNQSVKENVAKKESSEALGNRRKICWGRGPRTALSAIPSELNVWKYLFLLTLFLVTLHYCIINSSLYHN